MRLKIHHTLPITTLYHHYHTLPSPQIWNIFFGGRYILLLMSLFSMYTGIIYNDIFSKSFNIFGSSWHIGNSANATEENMQDWGELTLDPKDSDQYIGTPYPIGFDPIWQVCWCVVLCCVVMCLYVEGLYICRLHGGIY